MNIIGRYPGCCHDSMYVSEDVPVNNSQHSAIIIAIMGAKVMIRVRKPIIMKKLHPISIIMSRVSNSSGEMPARVGVIESASV